MKMEDERLEKITGHNCYAWGDIIVGVPKEEYDGEVAIIYRKKVGGSVVETYIPMTTDIADEVEDFLEDARWMAGG